jgi:hypothetical protein
MDVLVCAASMGWAVRKRKLCVSPDLLCAFVVRVITAQLLAPGQQVVVGHLLKSIGTIILQQVVLGVYVVFVGSQGGGGDRGEDSHLPFVGVVRGCSVRAQFMAWWAHMGRPAVKIGLHMTPTRLRGQRQRTLL